MLLRVLWGVLLWSWVCEVGAQDCNSAPTSALRKICYQLRKWDRSARAGLARPKPQQRVVSPPAIPGQPQPVAVPMISDAAPIPNEPLSCTDLACLCPYMQGRLSGDGSCTLPNGRRLNRALRKEYRMLSEDERSRYHAAFNQMKQSGEYDRLSRIHSQTDIAGGAHSGPAFMPWHREFMKRIEIALRLIDPDVALPYWDSVLDQELPQTSDSILWTAEFAGESDASGMVINGPFNNWRTLEGRSNIQRQLGQEAQLFTEDQLNYVYSQSRVEDVLAYTAPQQSCQSRPDWNCLEYVHGNPHIWVGGDMLDQSTSANDPIFYMHHSFVDLIWETWRQRRQSRRNRETDYPADQEVCSNRAHFRNADMNPFRGVTNIDGLSNLYTDRLYTFEPRPTCANGGDCGSPYIFCDRSQGSFRCMSKVRMNGQCTGFESEDICFNGVCQNGRCVPSTRPTTLPPTRPTQPPTRPPTTIAPFVNCFNEHECCGYWAQIGECSRNFAYMDSWCRPSCGRCRPSYDLNLDCSDHHTSCTYWTGRGECTMNPLWMAENCRQSCNLCSESRQRKCSGGVTTRWTTQWTTRWTTPIPTEPPSHQCPNSPGCYNEHMCCESWRRQGKCRTNPQYMNCNCKVSCRMCTPNYNFGTCDDYHHSCNAWGLQGQCGQNPWMRENCRHACDTCRRFPRRLLRRMCLGDGRITRRLMGK